MCNAYHFSDSPGESHEGKFQRGARIENSGVNNNVSAKKAIFITFSHFATGQKARQLLY